MMRYVGCVCLLLVLLSAPSPALGASVPPSFEGMVVEMTAAAESYANSPYYARTLNDVAARVGCSVDEAAVLVGKVKMASVQAGVPVETAAATAGGLIVGTALMYGGQAVMDWGFGPTPDTSELGHYTTSDGTYYKQLFSGGALEFRMVVGADAWDAPELAAGYSLAHHPDQWESDAPLRVWSQITSVTCTVEQALQADYLSELMFKSWRGAGPMEFHTPVTYSQSSTTRQCSFGGLRCRFEGDASNNYSTGRWIINHSISENWPSGQAAPTYYFAGHSSFYTEGNASQVLSMYLHYQTHTPDAWTGEPQYQTNSLVLDSPGDLMMVDGTVTGDRTIDDIAEEIRAVGYAPAEVEEELGVQVESNTPTSTGTLILPDSDSSNESSVTIGLGRFAQDFWGNVTALFTVSEGQSKMEFGGAVARAKWKAAERFPFAYLAPSEGWLNAAGESTTLEWQFDTVIPMYQSTMGTAGTVYVRPLEWMDDLPNLRGWLAAGLYVLTAFGVWRLFRPSVVV